ncbi:hypothetical protein D3C87_1286390 [compost metagenome]
MYTEAFLFVGSLAKKDFIESISFESDYFHVKFNDREKLLRFRYEEKDIIELLEIIETYEK